MKITILCGLPAAGKTTWAKEYIELNPNTKRVNKDDLRSMLDCGRWSKGNEKLILELRDWIILKTLASGKNIIVDDTNLHPKHEEHIKQLCKGYEVEVKHFDLPLQECIKRDLERVDSVGSKVIIDMYDKFIKEPVVKVEYNPDLPDCIICDVDGTVANNVSRGFFEWDKVGEDEPKQEIINILQEYSYVDKDKIPKIIIVTGRDGSCEGITKDWLDKYGVPYNEFYIRPEGNNEKDAIIKQRIYNEHIKDKYNVLFVLDDRNQVVDMWRSLGLTCLQVQDGNF